MTKGIKISLDKKIEVAAKICFTSLSKAELELLKAIIGYSSGNSITLTSDTSNALIRASKISQSAFSTSLHRLEKKGVIMSQGKTKTLHPVFNNINLTDKILISFG